MKKIIFVITISALAFFNYGQTTAVNFNCNDCSGNNHDLFATLNTGKIIVITWVMPCALCLGPALAAQSAVQSFSNSNPGQVLYYIVDDYANTSCGTLNTWCSTNGINIATVFSNSLINMADYGIGGMPKIIVIGGVNHSVYFNQNGPSTVTEVQNGINSALAASAADLDENKIDKASSFKIYPNPSNLEATLVFNLTKKSEVKIEIQNLMGQKILEVFRGSLLQGENNIRIKTEDLLTGNYLLSFSDGKHSEKIKLIIEQ